MMLRRRMRGQVVPIAGMTLGFITIFAWFLVNIASLLSTAQSGLNQSLHAAGLAALAERGTTDDYARWYVDGNQADAVARDYLIFSLVGDPAYGDGGYSGLFSPDTADRLYETTANGSADGLDVEVLNPATRSDQLSDAWLNGVQIQNDMCQTGVYPESMRSVLDGNCYTTTTVILYAHLSIRQATGTWWTQEMTLAIKAGTDV